MPQIKSNDDHQDFSCDIVLATTHSSADFLTQISETHKQLDKKGCHTVGRREIYHHKGLVKFAAYKWLNRTKLGKDEPGRIQVLTYAMPTTYNKSMAKNELFSIVNKDHVTHQRKELIGSLLYWSNLHYDITVKARINIYQHISLKDYLFWGKTVVHSTIPGNHQFEKIRHYKNFIISYNHVKLHIILTRPQKIIKSGKSP